MIKTRFAPSPTGHLHIGGVRTAIFNWAFARRNNGHFYLRIDDTDSKRNVEGATQGIVQGLEWLGLDYDCPEQVEQGTGGHWKSCSFPSCGWGVGWKRIGPPGIVYQSIRGFRYFDIKHELERRGFLYRCWCTKEELEAERAGNKSWKYSGKCVNTTYEQTQEYYQERRTWTYRVNVSAVMGDQKFIEFDDLILGRVSTPVDTIGDFIVVKAGGGLVYSLATTIDDHDMEITHVIRGQEHLPNTAVQLILYKAMGWTPPRFAHVPFICAPQSKRKLSKRDASKYDAPITLDECISEGYLPSALFNYLSHLGWAMDGSTEKWDVGEFIKKFSLRACLKKPSQFDPGKLNWLQGEYLKEMPVDTKVEAVLSQYPGLGDEELVRKVIEAAEDRIRFLREVPEKYAHFFDPSESTFLSNLCFMGKDIHPEQKKRLDKPGAIQALATFRHILSTADWTIGSLEAALKGFCESQSVKIGVLVNAVRVATTGTTVGFSLYHGMEILGRDRCLDRIDRTLELVSDFGLQ